MTECAPSEASNGEDCRLSVVIACFNGMPYLKEQLDALCREDPPFHWELIVADNGSTDGSKELARSYSGRLPIRVLDASDIGGPAHARNRGVAAARSEQIATLDADDIISPGYLQKVQTAIANSAFVAARMDIDSINPSWIQKAYRIPTLDAGLPVVKPYAAAFGGMLGMRKVLFDSVNGFDEFLSGHEDIDLCWRIQRSNNVVLALCDGTVRYRLRSTLPAIFKQARRQGRGAAQFYVKWRGAGMGRASARQVARRWIATAAHLCLAWRSKTHLARGIHLLGLNVGCLEGSIINRVLFM